MGKQRAKVLKRKAKEIYKTFPEQFSPDFEAVKKVLNEMKVFPTKITRNIAAGYIVGLSKEKEL